LQDAGISRSSLTYCGLYHGIFRVPPNYMHLPTCKIRAAVITVSDMLNATQEACITGKR